MLFALIGIDVGYYVMYP